MEDEHACLNILTCVCYSRIVLLEVQYSYYPTALMWNQIIFKKKLDS